MSMRKAVARGLAAALLLVLAAAAQAQEAGSAAKRDQKAPRAGAPARDQALPAAVLARGGLSVVLGRPSDASIAFNLLGDRDQEVLVEYGTSAGSYPSRAGPARLSAGIPAELELAGLQADREYSYRLRWRTPGAGAYAPGPEGRFRTARAPGSTFSFEIIGDSHPERPQQFDPGLYALNLEASAASAPDFFMTIGDDFSVDTMPETTKAAVDGVYRRQRLYLSLVGGSAPLFLVNGNHEQASLANYDGTGENVAAWAQNARAAYFPQPAPDAFYTGDAEALPGIGLLRDYYAFSWGDALIVVIDQYWHSPEAVDNALGGREKTRDPWKTTLGAEQYAWLKRTLEGSGATFKFVFAHHVSGTGRGGVERAPYFEWGGLSADGKPGFTAARPDWAAPIHELMVKNGVSAFIQGHDHVFANQVLDGVAYLTLPEPADPAYALYNADAFRSGDLLPNSGRVRFTVGPSRVIVEYLRVWLPGDRPAGARAGCDVAYRFEIPAGGAPLPGTTDRALAAPGTVGEMAKPSREGAAAGSGTAKGPAAKAGANAAGEGKPKAAASKGGGAGAAAASPEPAGSLHARTLVEYPGATRVSLATAFLEDVEYHYEYGPSGGKLDRRTPPREAKAGSVARDEISGLEPGKSYAYRLAYAASGSGALSYGEPGAFSTQRPAGSPFTFVVEADPHLDENSSGAAYLGTLARMAADSPDFAVDLGDTSMAEKLGEGAAGFLARNRLVRSYWDEVGGRMPFLMVLGNHDGEHGWAAPKGQPASAEAAAIRKTWLLDAGRAPPETYDVFSDTAYALEWGDALLVVLDPFSAEKAKPGEGGWDWSLGKAQYDWLAGLLARSEAAYRFVFIHNMLGGKGKEARGGADSADYYEWGGLDPGGADEFADRRPGWAMPLHDLFVKGGVGVVFRGHDHFYAREEKDGVVYQLVPQPSLARSRGLEPAELAEYGYTAGSFLPAPGYLRVSVSGTGARVEYLSSPEGEVAASYELGPR